MLEGKEQGIDIATARLNTLTDMLMEAGRYDELKASTKDKNLQLKLLKEFGLLDD